MNFKPKHDVYKYWEKIVDSFSWKRKLRDQATIAIEIYSSRIFHTFDRDAPSIEISRMVELLEIMMHGLKCVYVTDGKCFKTEEEMNEAVR